MRVEYKNPEILKRPDSRIVLKGLQGIWEASSKTLRLYYEGRLENMPREIYSTDGDYIMELILDSDSYVESSCGNIIYIEFPLDTMADISTSGVPSNITYLESRGYAIGENILRGINASRIEKFISKSSWYRYFRINRKTGPTNLKRLDWAGRSVSRDYYEKSYSNLQLFCDGVDEDSGVVYSFKMSTPCITFYGFATEETYKVEGNSRKLVRREIVSLENIPGLIISEIPGGTQNFVLSIDSEHLSANLLTLANFDQETSDIVYHTGFVAEVYDSAGQINASYPLEITTLSEDLTWHCDTERTTTIFREEGAPVFLFRHDDYNRDTYHVLRVSTLKNIDNIQDVSVKVGKDGEDDPYFTYEISLDSNVDGGNDIIVKIRPSVPNMTEAWLPRLYADVPEPRRVEYKNNKLIFYPILGPRNADFYIIDPDDPEETNIDTIEYPNSILGGDYLVKTSGDDTYWRGVSTNSKVYSTDYGYTGYIEPEPVDTSDSSTTDTTTTTPETPEPPKQTTFNFDIPGIDTSGTTDGLWIFPSSCCIRPGQVFAIDSAEVLGSGSIWCRSNCISPTNIVGSTNQHTTATAGGSSSSSVSRAGSSSGSGSGSRRSGNSTTQVIPSTDSVLVYDCFYQTRFIAPDTPGTYEINFSGIKDKSKSGSCKVTVMGNPDTSGDLTYLRGETSMIAFRKENEYAPNANINERQRYQVGSYTLKIYTYKKSSPNNHTLVTNLGASDCDIAYKITKSGIIDDIECTSQGLKISCGRGNYGVTELIIYLKSDPSIFIDIPVVLFGGKYKYYQSSLR